MNKEDILAKSRQENIMNGDEREVTALNNASGVGMIVGGFICIILALVSKNVFKCPEVAFAALLVFFAMRGSQDIAYCVKLKERKRLVQGILELTMAVAFAVGLVILLIK